MTTFIPVGDQSQQQDAPLGPTEITASTYSNSLRSHQPKSSATQTLAIYLSQLIELEALLRGPLKAIRAQAPAHSLANW